jgi:hypothetical protein
MYDTRTADGIALELDRQSFQEGVALQGMNRPRRLHDGGKFGIVQGEHGRAAPVGRSE